MANPRFLLRLITTSAIYLLTAACFGIVLWVVDEILGWDILPDAWSLLVQALLVAGGIIAFVLVVMSLILSLSLLAEASANRAELPNFQVSPRWRRRFRRSMVTTIAAVLLLVGGLQIVDQVRAQAATRAARTEFEQIQTDLDQALPEVLSLFSESLEAAIASNSLSEQSSLFQLRRLFDSVRRSFPHSPNAVVLIPSESPYDYISVSANSITANGSKLFLSPQFYAGFPDPAEAASVEALFGGQLPEINDRLEGQVLKNTVPSTWGLLEQSGNIVALVYLEVDYFSTAAESFTHEGPEALISE